jgi:hypothetical protein
MIDKSWAAPIGSIAFSTAANNRLRLFHSRSARACVGDEVSALSPRTVAEAAPGCIAMRTIVLLGVDWPLFACILIQVVAKMSAQRSSDGQGP